MKGAVAQARVAVRPVHHHRLHRRVATAAPVAAIQALHPQAVPVTHPAHLAPARRQAPPPVHRVDHQVNPAAHQAQGRCLQVHPALRCLAPRRPSHLIQAHIHPYRVNQAIRLHSVLPRFRAAIRQAISARNRVPRARIQVTPVIQANLASANRTHQRTVNPVKVAPAKA